MYLRNIYEAQRRFCVGLRGHKHTLSKYMKSLRNRVGLGLSDSGSNIRMGVEFGGLLLSPKLHIVQWA